jgi:AraC-like DNA-binding protein
MLFGASVSLLKALEQITVKRPGSSNFSLFLLFLCTTYLQAALVVAIHNQAAYFSLQSYYLFLSLTILNCFLVGPLSKIYYHQLIIPEVRLKSADLLFFIPSILSLFVLSFSLYFKSPSAIESIRLNFFDSASDAVISALYIIGTTQVAIFWIYLINVEFSVWNKTNLRNELRSLLIISIGWLFCPILFIIGYLLKKLWLVTLAGLFLSLGHILFSLAFNRYKEFFQLLKWEIKNESYKKSRLKNIDIEMVCDHLHHLMKNEKLYTELDLTIDTIASRLSVTPHQLSQLLNERLNTDFRNYINSFRVARAKELLVSESMASILSVCYSVGFGSKSAFNSAFKKITGINPTKYRENNIKN